MQLRPTLEEVTLSDVRRLLKSKTLIIKVTHEERVRLGLLKIDFRQFRGHEILEIDGCWIWQGKNGRGPARSIWQLLYGKINNRNLYICHTCDNPRCVRPEHLFLGSPTENVQDCIKKGRRTERQNWGMWLTRS